MSVIQYYSEYFRGTAEPGKGPDDVFSVIDVVTQELLKNNPVLVADVSSGRREQKALETEIISIVDDLKLGFGMSRKALIGHIFDYMFGYGPLQQFVEDEEISDIDGTAYNEFVALRKGKPEKLDISFENEEKFLNYCHLIAIRNYGILNENDPHCRISDQKYKLRINLSIPPRNVSGPCINIRKHSNLEYSLEALIDEGMLTNEQAEYLRDCAKTRKNMVFGGQGGSGKTTLMRALINEKPEMERLLICESDSELFPKKPYCIVQKIKRQNEGGRVYTLGDIVKDGLTMRIDTYVIGESVSSEAWEGLKAAHSGHGFLTTTHAMSAYECLDRMVLLSRSDANRESEELIREVTAKAIDVVIYLKGFKVREILEVEGLKDNKFQVRRV